MNHSLAWEIFSHRRHMALNVLLDRIRRKNCFSVRSWLIRLINPNASKKSRWNSCRFAGQEKMTNAQGHRTARLRRKGEWNDKNSPRDGLGSPALISICLRPLVMSSLGPADEKNYLSAMLSISLSCLARGWNGLMEVLTAWVCIKLGEGKDFCQF